MTPIRFRSLSICTLLFGLLRIFSPEVASAADDEIKAVVDANHAAITARNITQVAALWSQSPDVVLVNPRDTSVAVGWPEVRNRWERVFDAVASFEISQAEGPYTQVSGDVAWSTGIAHVVTMFKSGTRTDVRLVEVDILARRDGHWLLVSHTARPI